jgi:GT2 family glycosyltransferase
MNQSIVFVIVTYRPNKKVLDALTKSLSGWPVQIIDNTRHNRGYGGGANEGIRQAVGKGVDWLVVLNQDLRMTRSAVKEFTSILLKSAPAIVGPFAGRLDDKRWTTSVPATKMDYISGSCVAIHRDILEKIGEFYEPYFLYYEEVDFCMRAKRAGFPLRWLPIRDIEHEESVGLGRGSFLHQYYLARNHLLFVERQGPARVKLYEFLRLPKTFFEHIAKREWESLKGIIDYFLRRFGQL